MKYFSKSLITLALTRMDTALAQTQSVSTGFTGIWQADGNMFEIAAKDKPVLIERFDINMDAMTDSIAVYYRTGHVDYVYDDSYKQILFVGRLAGAGQGSVTSLPPFSSPVLLTPGTPLTFYVTCTTKDGANLWYDDGVGSGTTYASDDNINIIEGMASGYPWRGYALDRRWNGVVYYSLQSSSSPTESPTISLSTPNPTNQPTPSPTNQPTKSPVGAVTPSPTASPDTSITSPPNVSSPNPTGSPVDVATRTQSPSNVIDDVGGVGEPTTGTTSKPTTTTESDSSSKSPTTSPTKMPSGTQTTDEPTSSSPTVEETFFPTKTVTNLLPNFVPSSTSVRFNYMGRICLYSSPLLIIAYFILQ
eukprot:scaffold2429_cov149-Skeletonema_menzelii.AAC.3